MLPLPLPWRYVRCYSDLPSSFTAKVTGAEPFVRPLPSLHPHWWGKCVLPRPAGAGSVDPVILIGGKLADITYDAPLDALLKATGPTRGRRYRAVRGQASLVLAGPGFGWGEQVTFTNPNGVPSAEGQAAFEQLGNMQKASSRRARKEARARARASTNGRRQARSQRHAQNSC